MTEQERAALLKVQELEFAVYDIQLFLDTHPTDREAYSRFLALQKQAKEARENFEKNYGALTVSGILNKPAGNMWPWTVSPWPWEGGESL